MIVSGSDGGVCLKASVSDFLSAKWSRSSRHPALIVGNEKKLTSAVIYNTNRKIFDYPADIIHIGHYLRGLKCMGFLNWETFLRFCRNVEVWFYNFPIYRFYVSLDLAVIRIFINIAYNALWYENGCTSKDNLKKY